MHRNFALGGKNNFLFSFTPQLYNNFGQGDILQAASCQVSSRPNFPPRYSASSPALGNNAAQCHPVRNQPVRVMSPDKHRMVQI